MLAAEMEPVVDRLPWLNVNVPSVTVTAVTTAELEMLPEVMLPLVESTPCFNTAVPSVSVRPETKLSAVKDPLRSDATPSDTVAPLTTLVLEIVPVVARPAKRIVVVPSVTVPAVTVPVTEALVANSAERLESEPRFNTAVPSVMVTLDNTLSPVKDALCSDAVPSVTVTPTIMAPLVTPPVNETLAAEIEPAVERLP